MVAVVVAEIGANVMVCGAWAIVNVLVTGVAGRYCVFPACDAVIAHDPAEISVTVPVGVTEHVVLVVENVTGRPDDAVASELTENAASPKTLLVIALNVTDWLDLHVAVQEKDFASPFRVWLIKNDCVVFAPEWVYVPVIVPPSGIRVDEITLMDPPAVTIAFASAVDDPSTPDVLVIVKRTPSPGDRLEISNAFELSFEMTLDVTPGHVSGGTTIGGFAACAPLGLKMTASATVAETNHDRTLAGAQQINEAIRAPAHRHL
ncbi:MAG: hypothetical protein IPL91_02895 [Hyphomicrobium sp.]|nr:hypothetical protein [Hyphomicrobium sp.]